MPDQDTEPAEHGSRAARPSAPLPPKALPRRAAGRGRRWRILGLIAAVAVIAAVGFWTLQRPEAQQPAQRPGRSGAGGAPMPVGVATVQTGDINVLRNGLGTVSPLETVTIKTQINGQLTQIAFQEGQMVKSGDFLAEIDPRPYQVALEQAEGQLARDQALLKNAQLDLQRYRTLVAQNSIARQQADTQESLVHQYEGTVKTDQAQVDSAKLNLVYCHITSPVNGRVGLRQVDQGNYVQTSDANGIVVITQLQPITVIFTLPEDDLPAVLKRLLAGDKLQVTAFDRTQTTKLSTGALSTIDNQIDTSTGTFKLRAQFDNTELNLFPNQFVNAQLLVDTLHNVTIVPSASIQRGAPGTFVYLVQPDNTVKVQPVKLGVSEGEKMQVTTGLSANERVVVDGADKLRDGAKITIPPPPQPGGQQLGGQQPGSRQAGSRQPGGGAANSQQPASGPPPVAGQQPDAGQPSAGGEPRPGPPQSGQPQQGAPPEGQGAHRRGNGQRRNGQQQGGGSDNP